MASRHEAARSGWRGARPAVGEAGTVGRHHQQRRRPAASSEAPRSPATWLRQSLQRRDQRRRARRCRCRRRRNARADRPPRPAAASRSSTSAELKIRAKALAMPAISRSSRKAASDVVRPIAARPAAFDAQARRAARRGASRAGAPPPAGRRRDSRRSWPRRSGPASALAERQRLDHRRQDRGVDEAADADAGGHREQAAERQRERGFCSWLRAQLWAAGWH